MKPIERNYGALSDGWRGTNEDNNNNNKKHRKILANRKGGTFADACEMMRENEKWGKETRHKSPRTQFIIIISTSRLYYTTRVYYNLCIWIHFSFDTWHIIGRPLSWIGNGVSLLSLLFDGWSMCGWWTTAVGVRVFACLSISNWSKSNSKSNIRQILFLGSFMSFCLYML